MTRPRIIALALLAAVAAAFAWQLRPWAAYTFQPGTGDLVGGDIIDQIRIVAGLEKQAVLGDYLARFTGPWVMGNGFFRPFPSLVWGAEYALLGRNGLIAFQVVHLLSHLAFVVFLGAFLSYLLRNRMTGWLSAVLFAVSAASVFGLPVPMHTTIQWKASVDIWCGIASLLALYLCTRGIRQDNQHTIAWALAAYWFAVWCKEMAFPLPFLMMAILWYERRLHQWRTLIPFFLLGACLFAYRTIALQGYGARYGSNGSWNVRLAKNALGGWAIAFTQGATMPLFLASLALAAFSAARRLIVPTTVFAGLCVAALAWGARYGGAGDAFLALASFPASGGIPEVWRLAAQCLVYLSAMWALFALRERQAALALLWFVVAYLPLLSAPITLHGMYWPAVGWALWMAVAATLLTDYTLAALRGPAALGVVDSDRHGVNVSVSGR